MIAGLLHNDHRHVSAIHVAIFREVRTSIQLKSVHRNKATVNKSYNFFVKFTVKQHNITQYKIFEGEKVVC